MYFLAHGEITEIVICGNIKGLNVIAFGVIIIGFTTCRELFFRFNSKQRKTSGPNA